MAPLKTLLLLLAMITPAAAARGDPSAVVPETSPASDEAQPEAVGELLERRAAGSGPAEDTELAQTLMGKGCKGEYRFESYPGGLCYKTMDDGTAEFDPKSFTEITEIPAKAFYHNQQITAVTIPDTITKIGDDAFSYTQLKTVHIGNKVETIGGGAFASTKLTTVTIPDSVTQIEAFAFSGTPLKTVTIGNKVESIENHAFFNTKLTAVTIPDSVTRIGYYAFYETPLKTVTIGNKVESIEAGAFMSTQLTAVTIPDSVLKIGESAFEGTPLKTVSICNGNKMFEKFQYQKEGKRVFPQTVAFKYGC